MQFIVNWTHKNDFVNPKPSPEQIFFYLVQQVRVVTLYNNERNPVCCGTVSLGLYLPFLYFTLRWAWQDTALRLPKWQNRAICFKKIDITDGVKSNKASTIYFLCWLKQEGVVLCTSSLSLQVTCNWRLNISVSQAQEINSPKMTCSPHLGGLVLDLSCPLAQNIHEDVTGLDICFLYESCALPSCTGICCKWYWYWRYCYAMVQ